MAPVNLSEVLLAAAAGTPEAAALRHGDAVITYSELAERAARLAGGLAADGVATGDRVAIMGTNGPGFIVAYLGALHAGAVAVPVNPQAPSLEVERELDLVEPTLVLGEPAAVAGVEGTRFGGSLRAVGDACEGCDRWEPLPCAERAADDVAVLLFTAGTAGAPKAAMLTHGNLAANIHQVLGHPALALGPLDVALGVLPVFHVFGLNVALGVTLAAGASFVPAGEFDPAAALRLIRHHGVTVVAGVPAMYAAWVALPERDAPADAFASVRLAVSGAAALPPELAAGLRGRFGLEVSEGYGLTEASPIVTAAAAGRDPTRPGSIGPPLPGVDVRLVDVDGADVLAGDPGEIWVRGPNVFPGYWRDAGATARALTADGWLRTGDVAVVDDAGALTLVDRSKDMINVSGFNVYPAEVEDVLRAHDDVDEVAVVGEPHPTTGEAVIAFVVAASGRAPSADALGASCRQSLARYKCPARIEVVQQLPRSFAGKVLRRELRRGG